MGSERGRVTHKKQTTGISLSFLLWFAFSMFALMVVVVFALVQNALVTRQYRESVLAYMGDTGEQMLAEIASGQSASTLEQRLLTIANNNLRTRTLPPQPHPRRIFPSASRGRQKPQPESP